MVETPRALFSLHTSVRYATGRDKRWLPLGGKARGGRGPRPASPRGTVTKRGDEPEKLQIRTSLTPTESRAAWRRPRRPAVMSTDCRGTQRHSPAQQVDAYLGVDALVSDNAVTRAYRAGCGAEPVSSQSSCSIRVTVVCKSRTRSVSSLARRLESTMPTAAVTSPSRPRTGAASEHEPNVISSYVTAHPRRLTSTNSRTRRPGSAIV